MTASLRVRSNHRQNEILELLEHAGGSMRISAIALALHVTEETVRRNVKTLASDGCLEKVHGGVRLVSHDTEADFNQRYGENAGAKKRIAAHVADMIPDETSLFLDIGSTTAHIADALRRHRRLLVVTNSVYVAYRLATRNENRVFMIGGELRSHDGGAFGADAMAFASNFQTDFAVLSAAGISAANGFMLHDLEEAKFSRAIMARANTCIIAADSSKFQKEAPIIIGDPSQLDYLVSDRMPPEAIVAAARNWELELQIPSETD